MFHILFNILVGKKNTPIKFKYQLKKSSIRLYLPRGQTPDYQGRFPENRSVKTKISTKLTMTLDFMQKHTQIKKLI